MSVCSKRTDSPGFFTSCTVATGGKSCPCGDQVKADIEAQKALATAERLLLPNREVPA